MIADRILGKLADPLNPRPMDRAAVYLALAALQLEHGLIQPKIKKHALTFIISGEELEKWESSGPVTVEGVRRTMAWAQKHGFRLGDIHARRSDSVAAHSTRVEQSKAIELAYFGGFSHSEIAAMLEMPIGTVKGRIRLGLEKLRGQLGHFGEVSA